MRLRLEHDSVVPLHVQVSRCLREMIREPVYRDGKLLPPETELARRLGVSRNTLRSGIDELVRDGLLIRKRGVGTRVNPDSGRVGRLDAWMSYTREMERQGVQVETFSLTIRRRRPGAEVCKALELSSPPPSLLCLDRVKGHSGTPIVWFVSWFHPRLDLRPDLDFSRPLYDLLWDVCAVEPETSHERLTAVAADKQQATRLGVKAGTPLFRRERVATDAGRRPIEFAVNHYRGDRFAYAIDLSRSKG